MSNQTKRDPITRVKAQKLAEELLGPRGFARKKTKTIPGTRRQIGMRGTVPPFRVTVVGAARTWTEALAQAATWKANYDQAQDS